jgi:hypothetical protein
MQEAMSSEWYKKELFYHRERASEGGMVILRMCQNLMDSERRI